MNDTLNYCYNALEKSKVDKFQCVFQQESLYEMNLEGNDFSLIRSTIDNSLNITVINNMCKADISINHIDHESIDNAIQSVIELCHSSQQDPDYDISPKQEAKHFVTGMVKPDTEKMYSLLKEFLKQTNTLYPELVLSETVFSHNHSITYFVNSNEVDFTVDKGLYSFYSLFSSKSDNKTSSFNYSGYSMKELNGQLLDRGSLGRLLKHSVEHLNSQPFQGKIIGDLIITPDCLEDLLYSYVATYLGDRALISGQSLFKDKLDQLVADPKLTIHSRPLSTELDDNYFVTPDGFAAEDLTLIENGILKGFMLSLYGSKKTKLERAKNPGKNWIIEPGNKSLDDMIKNVEKGLLFARYSGGMPSANGDFSGVAKNSFYIENGKIAYPVTEVMIAGNLADLFKNIIDISKERICFGASIFPYIHTNGVTISGK